MKLVSNKQTYNALLFSLASLTTIFNIHSLTFNDFIPEPTKKNMYKAAVGYLTAELILQCRGTRTDNKGNWKINGRTMTNDERKAELWNNGIKSLNPFAANSWENYLVDHYFGTKSDGRLETITITEQDKEGKTITTSYEKWKPLATGSGPMGWFRDNVSRNFEPIIKIGQLSHVLSIVRSIQDVTK